MGIDLRSRGATRFVSLAVAIAFVFSIGLVANAQQLSPEEQCASAKSSPVAFERCVDSVRKAQGATSSQPGATGAPSASDGSMASQRLVMVFAIAGAIAFAALLIGLSFWRMWRRTGSYPVAELTALMNTMIPPEVTAADPNAHAVDLPARGGKTAAKFMVLAYVIAAVLIGGAITLVALGGANYIWIAPIALLPPAIFYAWFVVRRVSKSSDEWLAPLGLHVSKTPVAVAGPNPAGMVGGPVLRPYVVGPTTIEGTRFGREVKITQQSGVINSVSILTLVKGPGPAVDCTSTGAGWQGRLPDGAAGELIASTAPGPGQVHITGDGQGLVVNRTLGSRELLSRDGYGAMVRDLHFAEQIIEVAEGG